MGEQSIGLFQNRDSKEFQIFKDAIVPFVFARRILVAATGNENGHTLAGAGEENTVCVLQIQTAFVGTDVCPTITHKVIIGPFAVYITIVGIPCDDRIIQLQSLNIKFGHDVFLYVVIKMFALIQTAAIGSPS